MDYTQFLQKPDEFLTLPYFVGKTVCDDQLTYRLREAPQPGWYRFRKNGRNLTVEDPADPDLSAWKLPALKGYVFNRQMIGNDFQSRLYGLPADTDLAKFTPIGARKWFDGHILFENIEFESDVEPKVRDAFEEERSIDEIKGITPALTHTYLLESTQHALAREAERVVIIEFPDMNALNAWYTSGEYQPLIALRKQCTSELDMLMTLEGA